MNIFERATRSKLRFKTNQGLLSTEDLWDLSLTSLDDMAKATNRACKSNQEESFIEQKTSKATEDDLRLDLLKHVIKSKLAAKEASKTRQARQAQIARLQEIIANKADEETQGKSLEELEKELKELQTADVA